MIRNLPRIAVMLHVAFIAIYLAWLRGGTVPDHYGPIPWLSLFLIEMILLFPVLKKGETDAMGRTRVVRSLLTDPILYLGLGFLLFVGIQCWNGPCTLFRDVEAGRWRYTDPPYPGWPFSVNREEAGHMLYWFAPVYAVILAMRHGLSRKAKMNLLRVLIASSALLSLFGIVQFASGTDKMYWVTPIGTQFFASFGYPNHAGSYFTLAFAISVGVLLQDLSASENKPPAAWIAVCAACVVLNLLGATLSLCRAAILLSWAIALFALVFGSLYLAPLLTRAMKLRMGVSLFIGIGIALFLFFVAYPRNPVQKELGTLFTKIQGKAATAETVQGGQNAAAQEADAATWHFDNPFGKDRRRLAKAAVDIWQDYPWTGVGGWGFRHHVGLYVPKSDWKSLRTFGRANVHNDALQYLCEHGIIGSGLLLGTVIVLLVPFWNRLIRALLKKPDDEEAYRSAIFRVSPVAWFLLIGTLAVVVHSLIDLPFRCPAILVLWFICLCTMTSVLPKPKPRAAEAEGSRGEPRRRHRSHRRSKGGASNSAPAPQAPQDDEPDA
ncbi:MAG: O-antigen ligase family protein [Kiritimatiellia bacterium]|jgi:O-antigen ligase